MSDPHINLVILDLDGTLISTETLVLSVARDVIRAQGKSLTPQAIAASLGRRPLDAWQAVVDLLDLKATAQQLFDQSEPLLQERWHHASLLPGAARLVRHLKANGVRMALATSTSYATMSRKLLNKRELLEAFDVIVCGDDPAVPRGKPDPGCFLHVAKLADVPPAQCLVIEDAPSGVDAAVAAGMKVVVVPSLTDLSLFPQPQPSAQTGVVEILPSLLAFQPQHHGLPQFHDFIAGTIVPLEEPWRIKGPVVPGFGRGSKQLGIPTANLDAAVLTEALAEAVTGIYSGWASVGEDPAVYPMVMSVGFNPVFKNEQKTCEPWLLTDAFEGKDFYGQELRVLVVGYVRPERDFGSLQALIARIHEDAEVTKEALKHETFAALQSDPFLTPSTAM
jgi:riboflavin kinase / FMN hydrolase